MGWNKKIPPRRMPKTKSAAPLAPTKHTVLCDNFGVRRGGGGAPPPPPPPPFGVGSRPGPAPVGPLPPECCMPLECCSTASQHCSSANPHGAPLSLPGPGRTGGTRVYPPLCGGGWCGVPSKPPRGVPIPPRPRQDRRDSGVSAAVWGWVVWCPLITPTGRPYPSPAQAGPEGLGCIRRCVGVDSVPS